MKIYTKTGDDGTTGLLYGGRVRKDDVRTEAYGSVDEAVSMLGLARSFGPQGDGLDELLLDLQRKMFVLGAELATDRANSSKLKPGESKITAEMVAELENHIDRLASAAPLPDYFIVPGASSVSAAIDVARCIVRRAERATVTMRESDLLADPTALVFLNRLSDLLFAAARYEEHARGAAAPPSR